MRESAPASGLRSAVMDSTTTLAVSGPLLVAALVAALAGAVSFASPCVVPLVPGYLAYLAGLVGADAPPATAGRGRSGRAPAGSGWPGRRRCSSPGSRVVFGAILVGVVWLADALVANEAVLQRVGGVVMIAMGLAFVGLLPVLQPGAAGALGAAGRAVGRAAAGRGVRAGLGAVHRADAGRGGRGGRRAPAAARCAGSCSCWPTAPGSGCRSC